MDSSVVEAYKTIENIGKDQYEFFCKEWTYWTVFKSIKPDYREHKIFFQLFLWKIHLQRKAISNGTKEEL